ncbi:YkgJ family cysteine cluster protein [Marinilabiliaceae bacterium ANBcel2]|nr:YkgJ family cysteine cluster protein [Marinilabiliaceae bacterium ANBcel2]
MKNNSSTYTNYLSEATSKAPENRAFLKKLKSKRPSDLDKSAAFLHHKAFEDIDCLNCANCCKTTSPIITIKDIEKMARRLKIKSSAFIDQYLTRDEEGDYVYKSAPCPFLMPDNYCMIYEDRPKACREYPHTDRKKIHQILNITYKNTFVCPVVAKVVKGLKTIYK